MEDSIKTYLSSIGCCSRCIVIFLGETSRSHFNENSISTDTSEESLSINDHNHMQEKKAKESTCISCLGILQHCGYEDTVNKLSNAILDSGCDSPTFSLALSLPVSLGLRIHCIWAHLLQKYSNIFSNNSDRRHNHLVALKDVWRNIMGPKIGSSIGKCFVTGQTVSFILSVQVDYADDEKECQLMETMNPTKFSERRKQRRKFNEGVFTRQVVEDIIKEISDEKFLKHYNGLPSEPRMTAAYHKIQCIHSSIYMAGRYRKYSRELPQTPWLVEGERKMESSVQEYISESLFQAIIPQSIKFSASGREDVDVRCLGKGRPFVIEFINPRRTLFTVEEVAALQSSVNAATDLINVRDLQLVSRKDTSSLKDGEMEKTKSYCALCFSKETITPEHFQTLNSIRELTIRQMTPIRVLHRRPLHSRSRTIHTAKSEFVNANFFKLYLTTQAGTYIKEFVHGDFGRTVPNLTSLLGVKVDIIALDVQDVHLDWPPVSDNDQHHL